MIEYTTMYDFFSEVSQKHIVIFAFLCPMDV